MKKENGFTLIELLAVIVILAILVAAAVPSVSSIMKVSKQKMYVKDTNSMIDVVRKDLSLKTINNDKIYYYQLDAINELMVTKMIKSPYGNEYDKASNVKVVFDSSNKSTYFACLSDGTYNLCQEEQFLVTSNLEESEEIPEITSTGNEVFALYDSVNKEITYDGEKYSEFEFVCNAPKITQNMYPVKWNPTSSVWEVTTLSDEEWYTYNGDIDNTSDTNPYDGVGLYTSEKWANVQISTVVLSTGSLINESDLNLYVWIPRYTYLLDTDAVTVKIKYTDGINDNNFSSYLSSPAFTFGDQQLTGIWVAKFEMSANTISDMDGAPIGEAVGVSRPSVKPWRQIDIFSIFSEARTIESEFLIMADSHMIKSSEWAAVVYLTEAIRDGDRVWKNNKVGNINPDTGVYYEDGYSHNFSTGCGSSTTYNSEVNPPCAERAISYGCPEGFDYKTGGVKASTTGNIYGVYDLVGGAWETMATILDDGESLLNVQELLLDPDNKYKDVIDGSVVGPTVMTWDYFGDIFFNATSEMTQGLALHETTGWYQTDFDFVPGNFIALYPQTGALFFVRGGNAGYQNASGLYMYHPWCGSGNKSNGWRATIVL